MTPTPTAPAATTETRESSTPLLDAIAARQAEAQARYMPVMDIKTAVRRVEAIREMKELLLKPSTDGQADGDYGVIPGTNKPTLLKPGAEKICAHFGYVPHYELHGGSIEDWTGEGHSGEPLFYYHVRCILLKDGVPVGEGTGSASSWESKYRFKGKDEYGGGWLCFAKKGGCGAKYPDGDQRIEGQSAGQVINDNIFDLINTVQKMADKRAYVAATLSATGASQWFTQDMEDMGQATEKPAATAQAPAAKVNSAPKADGLFGAQPADPQDLKDTMKRFTGANIAARLAMFKQLKDGIRDALGIEDPYYEVLAGFELNGKPVEHANQLKRLEDQQRAIRLIWLAAAKAVGAVE